MFIDRAFDVSPGVMLSANVFHKFRFREESGKAPKFVLAHGVHVICGKGIEVCPIGKKLPGVSKS